MSELAALSATVHGRVQGVSFRAFVEWRATALGLTGYVRNLSSMRALEVCAEGEREKLNELLTFLRSGPAQARVKQVEVTWSAYRGIYRRFRVSR